MRTAIITAVLLALGLPAWGQTTAPTGKPEETKFPLQEVPKETVGVTVYNGGYGVVREVRSFDVDKNGQARFTDVATAIDPTTVHFKSLTDPTAKLLEQNYQFDLVSADKLLQKYVDQQIEVVAGGPPEVNSPTPYRVYNGTLMAFDGSQIIMKNDTGLTMIQRGNVSDIRFKTLPAGLLTRPTLLWHVATDKPGKQLAEVTYQTGNMGWHAEYVLVLDNDDATADLSGWVSVENRSGKTYTDAKMKFIAGDVRRVAPAAVAEPTYRHAAKGLSEYPAMEQKAFFEYHMYTLPRPSTVADNEVKQLEMFTPARGIKIEKKYLYDPMEQFNYYPGNRYEDRGYGADTASKKVAIFIEFNNAEANKLGIPLPAGTVRCYKQDTDKAMEFVGEEKIDHTPKDEKISMRVGNAFDVVGERKQTDFKIETGRHWIQEKIEIKVRNHKKEDVTVRVKEPLYRWSSWNITEKSHDFKKLDSNHVAFDVPVKADGETVVTYTVEYTW